MADAFTVGDAYHHAIMGPTNPNRMYLWTGCVGNVSYLGPGGTDGYGAGPATYNGLSVNNAYWLWNTLPEVLQAAGISWKIYQDILGTPFSPDFGDGPGTSFAGNFTDNPLLHFKQYLTCPHRHTAVRKFLHWHGDWQQAPEFECGTAGMVGLGRGPVRRVPQGRGER